MISKTPKFDALLQPILNELVLHTESCLWKGKHEYCEGDFEITSEDIEFLRMLFVPPPKYCPTCRRIRRLVHMNLSKLFKRHCNALGHDEQMISIFPENASIPVVDYQYFIGDQFNPFLYGRDFKSGESPLNHFFDFRKEIPMPSLLNRDPSSVNSEYSNGGRNNKNCYFTSGCYNVEDAWYSGLISLSKNIMTSRALRESEWASYSVYSEHIYKSSYIYFSKNITNSMFLYDSKNCDQCFGGVNLRNRKYVIWNEQKTKEEYEEFIKNITPFKRSDLLKYKEELLSLTKSLPINSTRNLASENIFGTVISNSKNLFDIVEAKNSENVRHADGIMNHKDSMDLLFSGGHSHHLYQTCNIGSESSYVKFSISSKFCTTSEFIFNSKLLTNCFMCIGLQNKSFCILNKQYTEEEYFPLVDEIKYEMLSRGEYGEFFDLQFSAQAYNFSMAGAYYPLSDDVIEKLGGYIGKESETNVGDLKIIEPENLSETIDEVSDSITEEAVRCLVTQKPFRITKTELAFYRRMKLPIPNTHPIERIMENNMTVTTGRKWNAVCEKCERKIETIYENISEYHIYCEECFKREVN